jgi:Tfp pilus assembly protein PilF
MLHLYLDRNDLAGARTMLQRSLAIDPNYAPAYESMAEIARRDGNDLEAAQLAQRARHLADQAPPGSYEGRRAGAATGPGTAGSTSAVQDRLIELGRLYQSGRWGAALDGFEALRRDAMSRGDSALELSAMNNIGLCRYKQGESARAESLFSAIVARAPGYVKAWNNLGLVRERQLRTREAIEAYSRALRLDPANRTAGRALERLRAGAPR